METAAARRRPRRTKGLDSASLSLARDAMVQMPWPQQINMFGLKTSKPRYMHTVLLATGRRETMMQECSCGDVATTATCSACPAACILWLLIAGQTETTVRLLGRGHTGSTGPTQLNARRAQYSWPLVGKSDIADAWGRIDGGGSSTCSFSSRLTSAVFAVLEAGILPDRS
jgi:hypothetical protein